jgi:putative salt-induced outer membrane protein
MKNFLKPCILAVALLSAPAVLMAQEEAAPDYGWSGKGELGFVSSSGNTDTQSLNLALELVYEVEKWRHRLFAGALNSENEGNKTANRYDLGAQSDYKLSEKSYVFGALRYEKDDFGAYEDQTTAAVGYGRQLLDNDKHQLKVEAGAGYRTASLAPDGKSEDGIVARGLLDWAWQITPTTSLGERFLVESGSDNTFMQNDLGLSVAINSRFAVKLGYQVRNNSDAPPGVDKTDTLTSANLVYHF